MFWEELQKVVARGWVAQFLPSDKTVCAFSELQMIVSAPRQEFAEACC